MLWSFSAGVVLTALLVQMQVAYDYAIYMFSILLVIVSFGYTCRWIITSLHISFSEPLNSVESSQACEYVMVPTTVRGFEAGAFTFRKVIPVRINSDRLPGP